MTNAISQPELQQHTLQLYGELLCRRSSWGGQLVLAAFSGAAASGLAAAASLAGAASLTVDADAAVMKAHFRDGAYDFVVNTLDEALRALKNEVRVGRPIAIGLTVTPEVALAEAAERGFSARLIFTNSSEAKPLEKEVTATDGFAIPVLAPSTSLNEWLERKQWLPVLLEEVPDKADFEESDPRRRWVGSLSTHQRSAGKRARWMWQTQAT